VVDDKGTLIAPPKPMPDTVSIIDVSHYPPTIKDTIEVPGSVVGPPMAVWVAQDESWAIVTSATKTDAQGTNGISADDRVSVIDLKASPPKIVQSLTSGLGATMVRLSPDGTLALIANRAEGTVSIFTVQGKRLTAAGKLDTGNKASLPSSMVFLHDGKTALLTRSGDNMVNVLHIDGTNVTIDPRPITTGISPYTMDINAAGTLASVSNMGRGDGDMDTVSLAQQKHSAAKPCNTRERTKREETTCRKSGLIGQVPCLPRACWPACCRRWREPISCCRRTMGTRWSTTKAR
jgi:DNA-binding beta-propeller fold protein YncE